MVYIYFAMMFGSTNKKAIKTVTDLSKMPMLMTLFGPSQNHSSTIFGVYQYSMYSGLLYLDSREELSPSSQLSTLA